MKKINRIVPFISVFWGSVHGQQIKCSNSYYLAPTADTIFITNHIVKNTSINNLILWFDFSQKKGRPDDYFLKTTADVSLLEILNDDNVTNKRFDVVGQSFIKLIKRKEEFTISIIYKSRIQWENNFLGNKIILMEENQLKPAIKNALKQNYTTFYDSEVISLIYELLPHVP